MQCGQGGDKFPILDPHQNRPNNLSLVCLYLSLYIFFLLFGHFFLHTVQIIKRKYIMTNKRQIIRSNDIKHMANSLTLLNNFFLFKQDNLVFVLTCLMHMYAL